MISLKLKKNKSLINTLIIFSFVLFSILNVMFVWNKGILNGNDLYFHVSRLIELAKSKAIFPRFALNTFYNNGSAIMTMYPYLLLYPFAIILRMFGHVKIVIYIIFIFNIFLTLMISYFSGIVINHRKLINYLFAIFYTISYEFISISFWSTDVGMAYAATFLPLTLFGFIYWIKCKKWLMLSIGMSLLIYSNVPMAIFTPLILVLWTLINYKLLGKIHIINLKLLY